jgi:hypothetical protein
MDFQGAAYKETAALQSRHNYLCTLGAGRHILRDLVVGLASAKGKSNGSKPAKAGAGRNAGIVPNVSRFPGALKKRRGVLERKWETFSSGRRASRPERGRKRGRLSYLLRHKKKYSSVTVRRRSWRARIGEDLPAGSRCGVVISPSSQQ